MVSNTRCLAFHNCMTMKLSEGQQGSGPEGDEVLWNSDGLSFVLSKIVNEALSRADC